MFYVDKKERPVTHWRLVHNVAKVQQQNTAALPHVHVLYQINIINSQLEMLEPIWNMD